MLKSERVIVVAMRTPLSQRLLREFRAQGGDRVSCAFLEDADVQPELKRLSGAPVLVLITWADLLRQTASGIGHRLVDRLRAFAETVHTPLRITLGIVPYGAFAEDRDRTLSLLCASRSCTPDGHATIFQELSAPLTAAGHECCVLTTPMLVDPDNDASSGYTSVLHKFTRIAACLVHEVTSKVPAYFSLYGLQMDPTISSSLNIATVDAAVASLLDHDCRPREADGARPIVHLENLVPWGEIGGALERALGTRLVLADAKENLNAVDRLLQELVFSENDLHVCQATYEPRAGAVCATSGGAIADALSALALHPFEPWESSYAPTRSHDLDAIDGVRLKRTAAVATREVAYYEGGAGEAVLLIPPMGIDPGYYAAVAGDLVRDHRVLVWLTRRKGGRGQAAPHRQDVTWHATAIQEVLRREQITQCHLVAWCDAVRVAAKLIEECAPMVRSLTLIAPELCGGEQTNGYEMLSRFFEQLNSHPDQSGRLIAEASKTFRAKPADLEQYDARASYTRSPLQYHPTAYWSALPEDAFTENILMWAQQSPENIGDVEAVGQRLAQFGGPVCVIAGTHDSLIQYNGVRRKCCASERWTLATFLGGNHYLLIEHGPAVAELLRRFIRDRAVAIEVPDRLSERRIRTTRHDDDPGSALWSSTG